MPARRCAIYTRKSTSVGLDQEFNTLDAQREVCERYVQSQAGNGWQVLPEEYDDGGFTGANLERPGFQKLMADAEGRRIDIVVVYEVDRLIEAEQVVADLEWAEQVLRDFDSAWALLTPENRCRLVQSVVKRVTVDEAEGLVTVALLDPGSKPVTERSRYKRSNGEDRP
jgi:hypothetical protein